MDHCVTYTVEPILKDHPFGHRHRVSQDRWSFVTGLFALKCRTFYQKYEVSQDRWSLMAVVAQDRFHCTGAFWCSHILNRIYSMVPFF